MKPLCKDATSLVFSSRQTVVEIVYYTTSAEKVKSDLQVQTAQEVAQVLYNTFHNNNVKNSFPHSCVL